MIQCGVYCLMAIQCNQTGTHGEVLRGRRSIAAVATPLGCTVFHELKHILGHPCETLPDLVEKCLGCG